MTRTASVPRARDGVSCGPLWVSPGELFEVRVRGERVGISVPAIRLLARLLEAGGRVVTREELLPPTTTRVGPGTRTVDLRVFRLRRALGDLGRYIVTVPGVGYRVDVFGLAHTH